MPRQKRRRLPVHGPACVGVGRGGGAAGALGERQRSSASRGGGGSPPEGDAMGGGGSPSEALVLPALVAAPARRPGSRASDCE
jgi:hypothetical protein